MSDPIGGLDDGARRAERRRRWLRTGLVASLALNLFFVGIVGVWLARPLFRGPPTVAMSIERQIERLPEADARALRDSFETRRAELAREADGLRQARQRMSRQLRADNFDPMAFHDAARGAREARSRLDAAMHQVYGDAASRMSAEGRRRLGRGGPRPGASG